MNSAECKVIDSRSEKTYLEVLKVKKSNRIEEGLLKIGEISNLAGLLPSCIRFYTQLGFLKVAASTPGGYWLFEKNETLKSLGEIKDLISKGLTMEQIAALKKKQGMLEKAPEPSQAKVRKRNLSQSGAAILSRAGLLRKNK